ncbi:malonyl-ACP O-methyltransferase BioC [Methylomonas sp. HYX-M1]|uniref:malonyl-ACP O-methyltransferase BioC n=1 Tax=Methylomonas sp. HYX-M1 TaxID=3139307 RepID=UPI00345B6F7E
MKGVVSDNVRIARSFAVAASRYDRLATLQREVGLELMRRYPLQAGPGNCLDLGCGTGFLTGRMLTGGGAEQLLALDIAMPMLQTARGKYPLGNAGYVCADAQRLPFADNSFQQIYSNLALQWVGDLAATFSELRRVITPSGRLVFATFGQDTLRELKAAWARVDAGRHVNSFPSAVQTEALLAGAGFERVSVQSVLYRSRYPGVDVLMHELKGLGANQIKQAPIRTITTKARLNAMIEHYQALMTEPGIVASYEILFAAAER